MNSKPLKIAGKVLSNLIFVLAVVLLAVSLFLRLSGKQLSFFGNSLSIVVTGSMDGRQHPDVLAGKKEPEKPIIKQYDFIITKKTDIGNIKAGDVVLYKTNDSYNLSRGIERILHKVESVHEDEKGVYLKTKGTANERVDEENIYEILGVCTYSSTFIGWIYRFLLNPVNLIFIAVLAVAAYVVIKQIKSIRTAVAEGKDTKSDSADALQEQPTDGAAAEPTDTGGSDGESG